MDLPDSGIESGSPALQADSLPEGTPDNNEETGSNECGITEEALEACKGCSGTHRRDLSGVGGTKHQARSQTGVRRNCTKAQLPTLKGPLGFTN